MKLLEYLKKNEKLSYLYVCWMNRNQSDFRDFVRHGYNTPDYLKISSKKQGRHHEIAYMIKETGNGVGFFGEFDFLMDKLYFADERGFIPYVEWGEGHLYYDGNIFGTKNVYEYYFKPVSDICDKDSCAYWIDEKPSHSLVAVELREGKRRTNADIYRETMAGILKKYVRFNERTKSFVENECETLLGIKRTVGIHFRGTDFHKHYNNHPVPVRVEQAIEETRKLMEKEKYDQVFLATDDKGAIKKFKEAFGECLLLYQDVFRESDGDSIAYSSSERQNHHYLLGLEVLRDAYTLTCCDSVVCGDSNISYGVRMMRQAWFEKPFDHFILIDNGVYHNDNYFWKSGHAPKRRAGK